MKKHFIDLYYIRFAFKRTLGDYSIFFESISDSLNRKSFGMNTQTTKNYFHN